MRCLLLVDKGLVDVGVHVSSTLGENNPSLTHTHTQA